MPKSSSDNTVSKKSLVDTPLSYTTPPSTTKGQETRIKTPLPALMDALEISKKAAVDTFEWDSIEDIFAKLEEERLEVLEEIQSGATHDRLQDEIGDLLFVVVQIARWYDVSPERALHHANAKFSCRFQQMMTLLNGDKAAFASLSTREKEALWQKAKKTLRNNKQE